MSDIAPVINKLRTSAARLNRLTDQINDTFKAAEELLNEACGIGLYASVEVRVERDDQGRPVTHYLEYRRVGGKYRIALVWSYDDNPEAEGAKAWSEATREDKLEGVAKLPHLLTLLAEKLDARIQTAEEAAGAASEMLKSLTGKEGK